jgi:hypothetical protein
MDAIVKHILSIKPNRPLALLLGLALLVSFPSFGQTESAPDLAGQLAQYRKRTLQEKLFVHTDRSFYLAGETIWFKVYNVDGTTHTPLDVSKVVYLEVLDLEQVPVLQAKVGLQEGTGDGSITLPTTLTSGHYVVRAYTNWMKNNPAAFFFEKPVTVVNTFKKLGLKPQQPAPAAFDVQFFPEGGHLVAGLRSKIAFKATAPDGRGVAVMGAVFNEQNDTLARFEPAKFGMGHFYFTPEAGQAYQAVIQTTGGRSITRSLPIVQEQGLVMHLDDPGNDYLTITVSSRTTGTAQALQPVHLVAHTRHEAKVAETRALDQNGKTVFTIPRKAIGEGITHFTIFNGARQPVCERLYFQHGEQLALQVATDQTEYAPRQRVRLQVEAQGAARPVRADLSVAVFRLDSLQRPDLLDIFSYFWLSSDLRGPVEHPEYYFNLPRQETDAALDNLLLTQGWRRFRWEDVLSRQAPPVPAHLPEFGGHHIRGRVFRRQTSEPAPNILTYLASPSRQVRLYGSRSNKQGEVFFEVKDLYGSRDLILQTNTRQDSIYRFEITTPFSTEPATRRLPLFDLSEALYYQLQARSLHLQAQNVHAPAIRYRRPEVDSAAFYHQPDKTYFLDEYTRFPVMEEVMREYVQPVAVRKRRGKFHFLVLDDPNKSVFQDDPLILLDGVPVFDTDRIMAYNPRKVQRLDVLTRKYVLGPLSFNGIVSYTTYKGTMTDFPIDPRALLMDYEGLQLQREFYAPSYDTPLQAESRIPDLRNLLYWTPSLKTSASGKGELSFFTSDQQGQYIVVVQGLTKDGLAGSTRFTFEVKRPL